MARSINPIRFFLWVIKMTVALLYFSKIAYRTICSLSESNELVGSYKINRLPLRTKRRAKPIICIYPVEKPTQNYRRQFV